MSLLQYYRPARSARANLLLPCYLGQGMLVDIGNRGSFQRGVTASEDAFRGHGPIRLFLSLYCVSMHRSQRVEFCLEPDTRRISRQSLKHTRRLVLKLLRLASRVVVSVRVSQAEPEQLSSISPDCVEIDTTRQSAGLLGQNVLYIAPKNSRLQL